MRLDALKNYGLPLLLYGGFKLNKGFSYKADKEKFELYRIN